MKRLFMLIFIVSLLFVYAVPAYADSCVNVNQTSDTIEYADGSYAVIETQIEKNPNKSNTKTASKTYKYYDSSDVLQWTFKVTGTFTYGGKTATATSVSTSYTILDNKWSFDHVTKSKSGATVTGTGFFKKGLLTKSGAVTIKCSKTGVIS